MPWLAGPDPRGVRRAGGLQPDARRGRPQAAARRRSRSSRPPRSPQGADVEWIPGYWAWDDERNDYLWISGIWRDIPPGRQWVPGYWSQVDGGLPLDLRLLVAAGRQRPAQLPARAARSRSKSARTRPSPAPIPLVARLLGLVREPLRLAARLLGPGPAELGLGPAQLRPDARAATSSSTATGTTRSPAGGSPSPRSLSAPALRASRLTSTRRASSSRSAA